MNRITFFAAVSAAALLLGTVPAFAQANQGGGFVTLDLNWSDAGAPPESELDIDTMRQILERDQSDTADSSAPRCGCRQRG